jgi:hypothetical protein
MVSLSCWKAKGIFNTAARDGQLYVLRWGEDSGYDLKGTLNEEIIAIATFNGYLEVVQYLRMLGISWNSDTCSNAAKHGHLEVL